MFVMKTRSARLLLLGLLGLWAMLLAPMARAKWPEHSVRLLVGFAPGGGTDIVARLIAQKLTVKWGQSVVVENRPGASGTLEFEMLSKSPPDGYTLGIATPEEVIAPSLYDKLPYSLTRDATPVVLLAKLPLIFVSSTSFKPNSIAEVIAAAKANPNKLTFASTGVGGPAHLAVVLLEKKAGIQMTHVPYKGSGPAYADLMGDHVQMLSNNIVSTVPLIESGKLKALAVTSAKRSPITPNVPSAAESGLSGFDVNVWYGVMAPSRTPKAVIDKVNQDINAILQEPDVRKQLLAQGAEPVGGPPEDFGGLIHKEMTMWADLIKSSGIKAEVTASGAR